MVEKKRSFTVNTAERTSELQTLWLSDPSARLKKTVPRVLAHSDVYSFIFEREYSIAQILCTVQF